MSADQLNELELQRHRQMQASGAAMNQFAPGGTAQGAQQGTMPQGKAQPGTTQ